MGKIFVKCKDKTSSCWLASQSKTVVGSIPQQVNETDEVRRKIALGVLAQVDAAEFERVHKKAKNSKDEKLDLAVQLFNDAIDKGNLEEAEKQAKAAKANGQKAADQTRFGKRVEALKTKLESEKELEALTEKAKVIIEDAIEKDVLTTDEGDFICLGDKRLGKEVDQVIKWAVQKEANLDEISKAIEEAKAE